MNFHRDFAELCSAEERMVIFFANTSKLPIIQNYLFRVSTQEFEPALNRTAALTPSVLSLKVKQFMINLEQLK